MPHIRLKIARIGLGAKVIAHLRGTSGNGVKQALLYYIALAKAHVPAELRLYARGGHAFALRPTRFPMTHRPKLADTWLRSIGMIGN